jgi:GAF domain-containing protein
MRAGVAFRSSRKPCRPASARSRSTPRSICGRLRPFRYLERTLRPLVQEDILASDTAPLPEFVERYGARAQILAPVVREGRSIRFVSVHQAQESRRWSDEEIAAIESAARRVAVSELKP